jgi:hypothetical protein
MTSRIRALSYSNLLLEHEYSNSKWKHSNDDIFNNLAEHMSCDIDKLLIADFLNLFYYFIIYYSKTCFKKNALWTHKKYIKREDILFRYELANELDSHAKLLHIQKTMNDYRKEYTDVISKKKIYFTESKKDDLIIFIKESIAYLCTDIYDPIVFASEDIKIKIYRYRDNAIEQQKKKKKTQLSPKLNYEIIDKLIADGLLNRDTLGL